jgi:type VI secretion system protein ImpM
MRCGLFGKLPAKRDFIAVAAPRAFLDAWEPWMQGGVSASREALGESWRDAYLTAPIWRFWLGGDICGTPVAGAFMSSLDGVGRYYPLTVFACADHGATVAPPDIDAQDDWFNAAEEFLLSTLDKDVAYESVTTALDQMASPASRLTNELPEGMTVIKEGAVVTATTGQSFGEACTSLRGANNASVYAAASFWWTLGGGDYQPLALSCRGMADPFLFAGMLTGYFKAAIK